MLVVYGYMDSQRDQLIKYVPFCKGLQYPQHMNFAKKTCSSIPEQVS